MNYRTTRTLRRPTDPASEYAPGDLLEAEDVEKLGEARLAHLLRSGFLVEEGGAAPARPLADDLADPEPDPDPEDDDALEADDDPEA